MAARVKTRWWLQCESSKFYLCLSHYYSRQLSILLFFIRIVRQSFHYDVNLKFLLKPSYSSIHILRVPHKSYYQRPKLKKVPGSIAGAGSTNILSFGLKSVAATVRHIVTDITTSSLISCRLNDSRVLSYLEISRSQIFKPMSFPQAYRQYHCLILVIMMNYWRSLTNFRYSNRQWSMAC